MSEKRFGDCSPRVEMYCMKYPPSLFLADAGKPGRGRSPRIRSVGAACAPGSFPPMLPEIFPNSDRSSFKKYPPPPFDREKTPEVPSFRGRLAPIPKETRLDGSCDPRAFPADS
ncbi:hypothetical protein SUTMEG_19180 [Sutterella megalosphaeroides]|uniref:Uncharacterized protein n=1 Tax=Sutterella megalosphaeroides TaxID=2494234 RepID=A0A2Z6IED4_9BURK|nr:hypothetical protein SUTMEG_19180 [Sutterella megalosphaeroides]